MLNKYGMRKTLDLPFEEALEKITVLLKEQGFGVLTKIDMKATLKEKLGIDIRKYVILGACNPNLAQQALREELEIGLLLPCNVIVYETDDHRSTVSAVNPRMMMSVTDNEALDPVAKDAEERLKAAVNGLN